MTNKIVVSMATMPCRKKRLSENIESILNQSYHFDVLLINVNNNVTDDDMLWYNEFSKQDDRIIINKAEDKWKSCNKLLPALTMYPNDIIITIDDDIYYAIDCFKKLVEQHKITPNCVVAHEVQPIVIKNDKIYYLNTVDVKLKQIEWGKYMTACTLFPPHIFDNSDLFDYDKMMYLTNGVHDELWFWVNSTLNNVMVVGLNYIRTFATDIITPWQKDEFRLATFNNDDNILNLYIEKINNMYGEQLLKNIRSKKTEFIINCDNVAQFCHEMDVIKILYNYGYNVNTEELTSGWKLIIRLLMNGKKFTY